MTLSSDFVVQGSAGLEGVDDEPTRVAALAVITETLGIWDVGAGGELARINEAVDLHGALVHGRVQNLVGLGHRCSYSGSVGGPIAADVVGMVTEAVQVVVLQRILAVVQPQIVRLALVESAAVVGDERGEVQVTAKSSVVTKIDGASAVLRHDSGFREHGSSAAADIPWMIAESIQMIVLKWILAIVQPNVVGLALVESAAIARNEHGEVQAATVGGVVPKIDWSGLAFDWTWSRDGKSCSHASTKCQTQDQ